MDKILFLQVGENGFNEEDVFRILIPKSEVEKTKYDLGIKTSSAKKQIEKQQL